MFGLTANLSFAKIRSDSQLLARRILACGYVPDCIVAVARGGLVPARLLSSELPVKQIVSVGMAYEGETHSRLIIYSLPSPLPINQKLLIVDDFVESGQGIAELKKIFDGCIYKTASLYIARKTKIKPDFFVRQYHRVPKFPWEN